jgi:hypothetical protein
MGSLDEWEVEPLLILLSIHVSLNASSGKGSKGAIEVMRRGGGGREDFKGQEEGNTYDKNVVFPTSASPKSKIITSGGSAMPTHHSLLTKKI